MNPPLHPFAVDLLQRLAWSIPYFVMIGMGLWISAKHKAAHPNLASALSLVFALFLAHSLLSSLGKAWMLACLGKDGGMPVARVTLLYGLETGVSALLLYGAWAVLLPAIHRAFQEMSRLSGGEIVDVRKDGA